MTCCELYNANGSAAKRKGMAMKRFVRVLLAVLALGLLQADRPAHATLQAFTCNQGVQDVVWDGGGLYIDCIGQPVRFRTGPNLCPTSPTTIDDVKLFQSIATAALLSGKTLMITYDDECNPGLGYITALTLSR